MPRQSLRCVRSQPLAPRSTSTPAIMNSPFYRAAARRACMPRLRATRSPFACFLGTNRESRSDRRRASGWNVGFIQSNCAQASRAGAEQPVGSSSSSGRVAARNFGLPKPRMAPGHALVWEGEAARPSRMDVTLSASWPIGRPPRPRSIGAAGPFSGDLRQNPSGMDRTRCSRTSIRAMSPSRLP